jgi:hypothetical protein
LKKGNVMKYNPAIHHRRSIRLKGHDYSRPGAYFVTIVTQDRLHLFGEVKNGKMILNEFGIIVAEEWKRSEEIRKEIIIDVFVIMPNHIHGILMINPLPDSNRFDRDKPIETNGTVGLDETIMGADGCRRGDRPVAPTAPIPHTQSIPRPPPFIPTRQ